MADTSGSSQCVQRTVLSEELNGGTTKKIMWREGPEPVSLLLLVLALQAQASRTSLFSVARLSPVKRLGR